MKNLIQNTLECVEAKGTITQFFIRDDDAGWAMDRLEVLVAKTLQLELPLDLAVIPMALHSKNEQSLRHMAGSAPELLGLHQHGYAHHNHQESGRFCEFGSDRDLHQQREDIQRGAARLRSAFGDSVDSIFTPPWNRCGQNTADLLVTENFEYLSRDTTAVAFDKSRLQERAIAIDWLKKRNRVRLSKPAFTEYCCQQINTNRHVGIMLHHEMMDDNEVQSFGEFVSALSRSPNTLFTRISKLRPEL